MKRQYQGTGFADAQPRTHFNTLSFQLRNFLEEMVNRQHDAVADIAFHAGAHHPTRNQIQCRFNAIDDQRMASVVPTLKANHALRQLGEPVDQLALALIAPLSAHHNNVAAACSGNFVGHLLFKWLSCR